MTFVSNIGVIGGSGFYHLGQANSSVEIFDVETPYSTDPVKVYGEVCGSHNVYFIPRHGKDHSVPPHLINYRANLWALKQLSVKSIIAVNAVGGISSKMVPGAIVLPDQLIDYTWGRQHTFFDSLSAFENHIDFTWPYNKQISQLLRQSAKEQNLALHSKAVYACTQGPRLETAAEVTKLKKDGCDIVGMTGMPEAALARELQIAYSCIAIVVNKAAGLTGKEISIDEMREILDNGLGDIRLVIEKNLHQISQL